MADRAAPLDVAQLVADHHQALYRFAYRLSGSTSDAEDLTQQAFLIAQQKSGQVRDEQCARAWLFTVLRNCYLKNYRGRPLAACADFDINTIPDQAAEWHFDHEALQAAIDTLANEFKIVVLLFYFEHRSYREIAELIDVPLGTVMSRLARAKAHLRRVLSDVAEPAVDRDLPQATRDGQSPAWSRPTPIRR